MNLKFKILFFLTFVIILNGNEALEKEIKQSLISPCCWAGTIYDLDHNPEMEEKIKELIQSGLDKNEILNYFVEIHGPRVLAVPKAEGFNAMVWIVPIIIFIGGVFFIALFFAKQQTEF